MDTMHKMLTNVITIVIELARLQINAKFESE